ncbi:MAG TPA: dihydroneopterin aldolase [Bacillota bacterium]|nr:dihydroneopterin aldolase [Bacillota bacterium]
MKTRIKINDIVCYGYHGVRAEEQQLGQEFRVNLDLGLDLPAEVDDRLENTVDYRLAVEAVQQVMTGPKRLLLETLAEEIAGLLLQLPLVLEATVTVCKPHPPIPGVQGGVSVIITRTRK